MVAKEEHETDEEHERNKHEEEDMELCRPIWQVPLGDRNERRRKLRTIVGSKKVKLMTETRVSIEAEQR